MIWLLETQAKKCLTRLTSMAVNKVAALDNKRRKRGPRLVDLQHRPISLTLIQRKTKPLRRVYPKIILMRTLPTSWKTIKIIAQEATS